MRKPRGLAAAMAWLPCPCAHETPPYHTRQPVQVLPWSRPVPASTCLVLSMAAPPLHRWLVDRTPPRCGGCECVCGVWCHVSSSLLLPFSFLSPSFSLAPTRLSSHVPPSHAHPRVPFIRAPMPTRVSHSSTRLCTPRVPFIRAPVHYASKWCLAKDRGNGCCCFVVCLFPLRVLRSACLPPATSLPGPFDRMPPALSASILYLVFARLLLLLFSLFMSLASSLLCRGDQDTLCTVWPVSPCWSGTRTRQPQSRWIHQRRQYADSTPGTT